LRYTFEHKKSKKIIEIDIPYAELAQFIKEHPDYDQVFNCNVTKGHGTPKADSTFQKYVLGRVAAALPKNNILKNSRFGIPKEI
jgi:hypothetical protein